MKVKKPMFVLGIGAQKAGTTWLHEALSSSPDANFGPLKEYHILDAVHLETSRSHRVNLIERVAEKLNWSQSKNDIVSLRYRMQRSTKTYATEFSNYLSNGATWTADITPAYSGLSHEVFEDVDREFSNLGIEVKIIFLMRDPVERLKSQVRMRRNFRKTNSTGDLQEFSEELKEFLDYDIPYQRGDYSRIVNSSVRAFGSDRVFFGLFETIFSTYEIDRLQQFLCRQFPIPDFSNKVNASGSNLQIDTELEKEIAKRFESSYKSAAEIFGVDEILKQWGSAENILAP